MATRLDPSGTTGLVRGFVAELTRRFRALRAEVVALVDRDDAFGLKAVPRLKLNESVVDNPTVVFDLPEVPFLSEIPLLNVDKQVWRFRTDDQKLEAFNSWLKGKVDEKLLSMDSKGRPWTSKYVESAHKKGVVRAYIDARGKDLTKKSDFFRGTQAQFLRTAFSQPELLSKVRLLATRAFEELKGVTAEMSTQLNRVLANGLVQGQSPREIARAMAKTIEGISKGRALRIARTEIVHAHAEGQLDGFEELGVDEVGVMAEWSTAEDEKVCPQCEALEGVTLTVDEARGLIPRHPNCRCAWVPVEVRDNRKRLEKSMKKLKKSLTVGGKRVSSSPWAGKALFKKLQRKGRK
jgi:SPP1 gp7 family putative phage head morphogenesis protein